MIVCLSYLNQPDNYDIINQRKLLLLWRFIMNNNCVFLFRLWILLRYFCPILMNWSRSASKIFWFVDDGSHQKKIFEKIGSLPQVTVLTHPENYGKGRALRTGLAYYKDHYSYDEYCGVITADSDGQHLVDDVLRISKSLAKREDKMILGVRDFDQSNVPSKSRIGNKLTSLGFRVLIGLSVSDTQTGLRGIPIPWSISVFPYRETVSNMKLRSWSRLEKYPVSKKSKYRLFIMTKTKEHILTRSKIPSRSLTCYSVPFSAIFLYP